jgi:transcription elongation factor SPT5
LQENEAAKRKKKRRPPAKPFDPEAIRSIGGDVASDGDFLIFEGNRYSRKGFLYKNFTMSAIIADGVYGLFLFVYKLLTKNFVWPL